jgi:hypothetical protein
LLLISSNKTSRSSCSFSTSFRFSSEPFSSNDRISICRRNAETCGK